jgi:hypothetical protein
MAVRDCGAQALSSGCPAARTGRVGGSLGLIDEDEAVGIQIELPLEPGLSPSQDVWSVLLGRMRRLFFTVIRCRSKKRHKLP